MKTLFILQPIGGVLAVLSGLVLLITFLTYLSIWLDTINFKGEKERYTVGLKKLMWVLFISGFLFIGSLPVALSDIMVKNYWLYSAVESGTTQKAVETLGVLLDEIMKFTNE